jgi:hypothetical protein
MTIPAKLEVMIKINQLPDEVTTKSNGWKEFSVDCGGRLVSITLRPRVWIRLEEAHKNFPLWVAMITGQMGASHGKGFALTEPNMQVFERKARPAEDDTKPAAGDAKPREGEASAAPAAPSNPGAAPPEGSIPG